MSGNTVCLFGNIGTGHLNPMLVLAERLTERGWTVLFYAPAHARERVLASGATWCNYGSDDWDLFARARRATAELLSMTPDVLLDMSIVSSALPATTAMLPYLVDEIERHQPLFTVHDAAAPWGELAGRLTGRPRVCSMSAFPLRVDEAVLTYPPGAIQKAAAQYLLDRYGASCDPDATYVNYTGFNLIFTCRHWAGERADAAHHFCGPTLKAQAPGATQHPAVAIAKAARAVGQRVVFSSFGMVVSGPLNQFYEHTLHHLFMRTVDALDGRGDVRLILSSGRKGAAGTDSRLTLPNGQPLPGFVHWFEYTPQPQLLEFTDVFVTHAGMNSTNEAAWHGVPVVCCPFFGDGVSNARRFVELGAGVTVDYGIATPIQIAAGQPAFSEAHMQPGAMRSALYAVLDDPSYRRAAAALRNEFRRATTLDQAIDEMLEWVAARAAPVQRT